MACNTNFNQFLQIGYPDVLFITKLASKFLVVSVVKEAKIDFSKHNYEMSNHCQVHDVCMFKW